MKIDRYSFPTRQSVVKLCGITACALSLAFYISSGHAQNVETPSVNTPVVKGATAAVADSTQAQVNAQEQVNAQAQTKAQAQVNAQVLLHQVMNQLANGPAFDAKVRQRVWTAGREVVGVGTYEQAGQGSGHYNLQMTMHDGDGKHTLQQISDGRLAWTRSVIHEKISLRRVDVGRLNEWVRPTGHPQPSASQSIPAKLKVGAWMEILDSIERDYALELGATTLKSLPVWVITGKLRDESRKRILQDSGVKTWPELFPTHVKIAIAKTPDPETLFGQGLPYRIEYWTDPIGRESTDGVVHLQGRLVSLIEIYSIRPIAPPPIERFRFENQDTSAIPINETDRYLRRHGIRLTQRQQKQRRR
ncbi:MAG: hypothetical protein HKN47_21005 [Pirellulaceae bacterium]|nr:hypothetical protein [Pirellulaceae bacterium]